MTEKTEAQTEEIQNEEQTESRTAFSQESLEQRPLLPRYFSTTAARTHFKISC